MWRQGLKDTCPKQHRSSERKVAQREQLVVAREIKGVKKQGKTIAPSHVLASVGTFTFCLKCGRYTSERLAGLSKACPRKLFVGHATGLKRLKQGNHPRTNVHLGDVTWVGRAHASTGARAAQARLATVVDM
eukprot:11360163-Karenia_brevis.AAC.1